MDSSKRPTVDQFVHSRLLDDPDMCILRAEISLVEAFGVPLEPCPALGPDCVEIDIHPIFRYENFDQFEGLEGYQFEAWKAMAPALTIVSKFLKTPKAHGWYHQVINGLITTDSYSGKIFLHPISCDQSVIEAKFSEQLQLLTDNMRFFWVPSKILDGSQAWAVYSPSYAAVADYYQPKHQPAYTCTPQDMKWQPYIGLSMHNFYHLVSPSVRTGQTLELYLQRQFLLAFVILHELGHAFYDLRYGTGTRPGVMKESCVFHDDPFVEAGWSFEHWALGGNSFWDPNVGIMLCTADGISAPIPSEAISSWFLKASWDHIDQLLVRHRFQLYEGGKKFALIVPGASYDGREIDQTGCRQYLPCWIQNVHDWNAVLLATPHAPQSSFKASLAAFKRQGGLFIVA